MKVLQEIEGMDIYLLDQLMKGTVNKNQRILDAGCGAGRNLKFLLNNKFNCVAIDPKEEIISKLRLFFPENKDQFFNSTIEDFQDSAGYDSIICNAVLHFACNNEHFEMMFDKLIALLRPNGILFIRTASDIGLNLSTVFSNGAYQLPEVSSRYLITEKKVVELLNKYPIELNEPIKTVNINNRRCMTTLVIAKL